MFEKFCLVPTFKSLAMFLTAKVIVNIEIAMLESSHPVVSIYGIQSDTCSGTIGIGGNFLRKGNSSSDRTGPVGQRKLGRVP